MSIIELGGGEKPSFRPNLDRRKNPNVDIVADLESPLPLKSEEFDLVYCQYAIEHISWRCLKRYIAEIHRILKPNGKAAIITANLFEQCKKAINEEWTENTSCMIFGDQNYGENAHKCGFSPEYAVKLFRDAGFVYIKVAPLSFCATDMLIEVTK